MGKGIAQLYGEQLGYLPYTNEAVPSISGRLREVLVLFVVRTDRMFNTLLKGGLWNGRQPVGICHINSALNTVGFGLLVDTLSLQTPLMLAQVLESGLFAYRQSDYSPAIVAIRHRFIARANQDVILHIRRNNLGIDGLFSGCRSVQINTVNDIGALPSPIQRSTIQHIPAPDHES